MNAPTTEEFNAVYRDIDVAMAALASMVTFLLAEKKPIREGKGLSAREKELLLKEQSCPDCGGVTFYKGPEAGLSTNIKCFKCGSKFNVCPPIFAERI